MNILLTSILVLFYSSNLLSTSTSAFSYSSASNNNSNFYFRSAKKITGASSHHSPEPGIPSSWKSSSTAVSGSQRFQASQGASSSSSESNNIDDEESDEDVEPGKMRVSEIKAELDLREVSYKDCFDKESLVSRLQEARATGKANPKILESFNKQKLEETIDPSKRVELREDDIANAVANDGKLPGGLSPEQFKKLTGNPEIMVLLRSTKMQEAMKLMMTGGREELESKLTEDPELRESVLKLDSILRGSLP